MLALPNGGFNTAASVNSFLNLREDVKGANGFAQLLWTHVFWRYEMKSNLIWLTSEKYYNHKKKRQFKIYVIYPDTLKKNLPYCVGFTGNLLVSIPEKHLALVVNN